MFETGGYLRDDNTVKSRKFEWCARRGTLFRVKAALTMVVVTAANDVSLRREEQSMRSATAHLYDFLLQHVEGIKSNRQVCRMHLSVTQLSILIVTPGVNLRLGRADILDLRGHEGSAADNRRKVSSTRHLFHGETLEGLYKNRRSRAVELFDLSLRHSLSGA